MPKYLYAVIAISLVLLSDSCKKDVLHWQNVQQLNSHTTARLNAVRFITDSICIAAGGVQFERSDVLRSVDGGYTWTANSYPDAPKEMYGIGLSPDGKIYLSGIDGDILHSSDSGNSWQFHRIDNWQVYTGGTFVKPDLGIFVSSVLQRQSAITRVNENFKILDEKTYLFGLNNIYMINATMGYVIGYGAVMKTTDGGSTWNFLDVNGDNFIAMDIHGDEIWMCGTNGGIYHTYDGGKTWKNLRDGNNIALPRYYLRCIIFKDEKNGWAAGDDGKVIYTRDGGINWSEYDHFTTSSIRGVTICPNGDLLVCGDNGTLYRLQTK